MDNAEVIIELTESNIDGFFISLRKRLTEELKTGAPIKIVPHEYYPEPRTVEIAGKVCPYPAIGETISIQIGFRPEEL